MFNHIAPWIVSTDLVQENSTERMSQLGLNYRGSQLSVSHAHPGSLRAGDRVPDLPVTVLKWEGTAEKQSRPVTTFGLMDPSTFTLFSINIPDGASTHVAIRRTIDAWRHLIRWHRIAPAVDSDERFRAVFGMSPSILLVRPDGYLSFSGTDQSVADLASYCDRWLLPVAARQKVAALHA